MQRDQPPHRLLSSSCNDHPTLCASWPIGTAIVSPASRKTKRRMTLSGAFRKKRWSNPSRWQGMAWVVAHLSVTVVACTCLSLSLSLCQWVSVGLLLCAWVMRSSDLFTRARAGAVYSCLQWGAKSWLKAVVCSCKMCVQFTMSLLVMMNENLEHFY